MASVSQTLAQASYFGASTVAANITRMVLAVVLLAFIVIAIAGMWKVFVKAGRPGWAAIVPIYNSYVLSEISGRPGWFGLLAIVVGVIPVIGYIATAVMLLVISLGLAEKFGKTPVFGVFAIWIFSVVGFLILGFGKDTYDASKGPQGTLSMSKSA